MKNSFLWLSSSSIKTEIDVADDARKIQRSTSSATWHPNAERTAAKLLPIYGGSTFMLCSHVTSKKFANLAISETFNPEKKVTRRTYVLEDGHIAATAACIIG